MQSFQCRLAARPPSCASSRLRRRTTLLPLGMLWLSSAHAVIVRGRITDPLGKAVPGARVQLVEGGQVDAIAYADPDGSYEIRFAGSGRFTLLGSGVGFLPVAGQGFYSGATDVVVQDVVLAARSVQQDVSVTATSLPTPLAQLTAPVTVLPGTNFSTRIGVVAELRQAPGVFLVQNGGTGGLTSLFLRGGNSTANLVLVDGIPAIDIGGTFDYGTVSSTGIDRVEVYRGPDSAIYGTDAGAGVVSIETPRGSSVKPVLTYSGDAGNLHTWRNEVSASGAARRFDYYGAYSRFDTSNALPRDRFHASTAAINLGYSWSGNTQLRFTLRNADTATGLPGAYGFYSIASDGKQKDWNLYSGATLENRTAGNWHNLVRYGVARKRERAAYFTPQGTPITFDFGGGSTFTEYFGNVVQIRGANGYLASGRAAFLNGNSDRASNRDQLYYQSDWSESPHLDLLFGFRYDDERGVFNAPDFGTHQTANRTNFEYNVQLQGQFWSRLFYSAGGAIEKNHLYGLAGTPRLGLALVPVRPGRGWLHGTRLRANAATGVQEPTLALEYASLYRQLLAAGDTASLASYRIGAPAAQRSRTYDLGIDQNVLGQTLLLKLGYFHNVFDRQLEGISGPSLKQYFGISVPARDAIFTSYLNSLAFRSQGAELELEWKPGARWFVGGGYTFLATRVLQSFASDAVAANQGVPTTNPNLPGIAIGAESPLIGGRVFRRAPHTGFLNASYSRPKFSLVFKGALASRSDDSTFLDGFDPNFGNSLLLPNRNLDFGYAKLDLAGTYSLGHRALLFTQLENLLNNQHIGPIGFPGLPLTVRAGVKLRLGGESL